jgi:hypothetical protein
MVRKLTSDLVSQHWDKIKLAIVYPFDPQPRDPELFLTRFLSMVLQEKAAVWIGLSPNTRVGDLKSQSSIEQKVCVLASTVEMEDPCGAGRHLLVYSIYGYHFIEEALWKELIETIIQYAKDRGISRLAAYSKDKRVIEMAGKMGADTQYHCLSLELK